MRTMNDPKKTALIWSALGVVTAPSILFVYSWSRLQNLTPDSDRYLVAYLLGYVVLLVLAIRTFRHAVNFGRRNFTWSHHAGRMFTVFTVIFVLEVVTQVTWNFSDFLSGITQWIGFSEFPIYLGELTYFITSEEIFTILILLLTLPLSLRLLDAYFDFLNGWIASIFEVFQAEAALRSEAAPKTTAVPSKSQTKKAIDDFETTAVAAITRADLKSYAAMAGIFLSVAISITGFIYVFQTSATTRAGQIIESIERTPIAFSGNLFKVVNNLQTISKKMSRSVPIVVETVGQDKRDEETVNMLFETTQGKPMEVDAYLRNVISNLQDVGNAEGTLTAEGEEFLAQLRNLRKEISETSRTNWDMILLRTAIIVMALVSVKIFHSIMMAASRERYSWENKLAAMRALQDGALTSEQVEHFLALQSDTRQTSGNTESGPLPVNLENLIEKAVAERFRKG